MLWIIKILLHLGFFGDPLAKTWLDGYVGPSIYMCVNHARSLGFHFTRTQLFKMVANAMLVQLSSMATYIICTWRISTAKLRDYGSTCVTTSLIVIQN